MDYKQIEAFVNVIKYKSFSKAADALFLTQPTVSMHISILEKEFGTRLIDRRGREALPTKQGKILYKYCTNMLNMREEALFSLRKYEGEIGGILEIQASSVPGEYLVPALMAEFRKMYPSVKFYLEQSDSDSVEKNISEQKGEIGFIGHKGSSNLCCEKLISDHMVLIAPKNEKFKSISSEKIRIEEFIDEPFVWREEGSATRRKFEDEIADMGFNPKRINAAARVNSMEAIKTAVSSGLGVSIISNIAVESDRDSRNYLIFEIEDVDLDRDFYLVWNKNASLSPTAEMFRRFAIQELKQEKSSATE